jgi:hypothetical protein
MLKILMLSILLLGIVFPSFANCGPPDEIDKYLELQFNEQKTWAGLSEIGKEEQQLTYIYENPKSGSWTIAFYSLKDHQTCILMMGQSSTYIGKKPKGSKS